MRKVILIVRNFTKTDLAITRKLLEKVHLEAEIWWDFITGKAALYLALCNSGNKQYWEMFFLHIATDVGDCHYVLKHRTRNTTEHRKERNKRKGHLITYKFGEFRCSERVIACMTGAL